VWNFVLAECGYIFILPILFCFFLQLFEEYFSPYFVSDRYAVAEYFWTDASFHSVDVDSLSVKNKKMPGVIVMRSSSFFCDFLSQRFLCFFLLSWHARHTEHIMSRLPVNTIILGVVFTLADD